MEMRFPFFKRITLNPVRLYVVHVMFEFYEVALIKRVCASFPLPRTICKNSSKNLDYLKSISINVAKTHNNISF